MPEELGEELLSVLEAQAERDPSAFPALAEVLRRKGRLLDAEGAAREGLERAPDPVGAVALGLSLIDQGRLPEARQVLVEAIADALGMPALDDDEKPAGPAGPGPDADRPVFQGSLTDDEVRTEFERSLTEEELQGAFDSAEAERDEMIDADRVAQEVLSRADPTPDQPIGAVPDSVFATETVAGLLEQQGDVLGASEVREAIRTRDPQGQMGPGGARLATLERWLDNLRKERT